MYFKVYNKIKQRDRNVKVMDNGELIIQVLHKQEKINYNLKIESVGSIKTIKST